MGIAGVLDIIFNDVCAVCSFIAGLIVVNYFFSIIIEEKINTFKNIFRILAIIIMGLSCFLLFSDVPIFCSITTIISSLSWGFQFLHPNFPKIHFNAFHLFAFIFSFFAQFSWLMYFLPSTMSGFMFASYSVLLIWLLPLLFLDTNIATEETYEDPPKTEETPASPPPKRLPRESALTKFVRSMMKKSETILPSSAGKFD